ncbi:DNA cytosine methyltransferase (plasmid) [Cyanobacterium sp. IPPAS B-1200]|uniref:DNA cytosine methyltransferase n=1 Tax=Cyanobacterium sp. IPPAS B-1200 TaxID=1562720 RepID=UPI0008528C23|nr:DNA cytosine methyltransferase [Cyanobacterium sp. IPPAS B-1200]OEJ77598.1 DNA cytosine methyltransferase [Cyanobacterium sp. IPPAS B-1200]
MIKRVIDRQYPQIVSLFSGCGGMDLGAEWAGGQVIWANELNTFASQTYKNYPLFRNTKHIEGPIEDIDLSKELPNAEDVDVVLGGFPCQDFSMIWKRPGLEGTRGNLYTYFVDVVRRTQPSAFVAENVKGLLSANKGKAIQKIQEDFSSCGYNLSTYVYNFADYGVAQLRKRVLIIGIKTEFNISFLPPPRTHAPHDEAWISGLQPYVSAKQALQEVEKIEFNNEHQNLKQKTIDMLTLIPPGGNFTDIPKDHPLYVKGMISHVYRRLHPNQPSTTIIAAGGGGTWGYHYREPRSLTNRERARLFGFPDDMRFYGSISEVRRQIGNAVPPVGVKPILEELFLLLKGKPRFNHTVPQKTLTQR